MPLLPPWLRRVRSMLGIGVIWATWWAVFGLLIGVASRLLPFLPWDAFFTVFDAPLPSLAIPGFVGGCLFAVVFSLAARRRSVDHLSMRRLAACGALGGLLLSLVPATLVGAGLASVHGGPYPIGTLTVLLIIPFTALGAGSASLSLVIARRTALKAARPNSVRYLR